MQLLGLMTIVGTDDVAYKQTHDPACWLVFRVGSRLVLFYVSHMNPVNSRNESVMMTASSSL